MIFYHFTQLLPTPVFDNYQNNFNTSTTKNILEQISHF